MLKQVNVGFYGATRYETAAEICNFYDNKNNGTVIICSGNESQLVDACVVSPLACTINAPILLTHTDRLEQATEIELVRMKPSRVIIVGQYNAVSKAAEDSIRAVCPKATIDRLGGETRIETCYQVLTEMSKHKTVDTFFIVGAYEAEADGLSIAPYAGMQKQPIILVNRESIHPDIKAWMKKQNAKTAYFIGGMDRISHSLMEEVNTMTSRDCMSNRLGGNTRIETNNEVNKRFFTLDKLDNIIITKAYVLADAATAGPLASKLKCPIIFGHNYLVDEQKEYLKGKMCKRVIEAGANIGTVVTNQIRDILKWEEYDYIQE